MTAQPEDVTEKLLLRAEMQLRQLRDHLGDTGAKHYQGRVIASHAIINQMVRDYRYHKATAKADARRRRAIRRPPSGTVYERL